MEERRTQAAARGNVLRYLASVDGHGAQVGLQEIPLTHPAWNLTGSDNLIVITSDRYLAQPLVMRGPGAGVEVTAAGMLEEILSL
jgi:homoserine dehydrogenase